MVKSKDYKLLQELVSIAPAYDNGKDFERFRDTDYTQFLDMFEQKLNSLSSLNEGNTCTITKGLDEPKTDIYEYYTHSEIWEIKLSINGKTNNTRISVPKLDKYVSDKNYLILNGKHYIPTVTLGLATINVLDKSHTMTIMLSPDYLLLVRGDKVRFTGGHSVKIEKLVGLLEDRKNGVPVSNKVMYDLIGVTYNSKTMGNFFEFMTKWLYFDHYQNLNRTFYERITGHKVSQTIDPFELILKILTNISPGTHINYGDFKQRRLVFGEYMTSSLWNFYRTIVFNHLKESNFVPNLKKNTIVGDNFHAKMHRGLLFNNASPYGFGVFKISQKQPGTGSNTIMPTEWIQCNSSAFKITCPTSISSAAMGKNLYLTTGIQVDKHGLFWISTKSELMSMQLSRIPFMATVDPSRSSMQAKYTTQATTSGNQSFPYIESYETYNKTVFNNYAEESGTVLFNNGLLMKVKYNSGRTEVVQLPAWKTTDSVNGVALKDCLRDGVSFNQGDKLTTYVNQGKFVHRARVAYLPFMGYSAEDANVISESFAKRMTIDYGHSIVVPITKYTVIHDIAVIGQIFDNEAVIVYDETTKSMSGLVTDIKYHGWDDIELLKNPNTKIMVKYLINTLYKSFENSKLTEDEFKSNYCSMEERTLIPKSKLQAICGIHGVEFSDVIGFVEIKTIDTQITGIADKSCGMYANKGVSAIILPDIYMPIDKSTNLPIDILFNPLGVPRRNNHGLILEGFLGKLINTIELQEDKATQRKMMEMVRDELLIGSDDDSQYKEWLVKIPDVEIDGLVLNFKAYESKVSFVFVNEFMLKFDNTFVSKMPHKLNELHTISISSETYEYLRDVYKLPFGNFTLENTTVQCQVLNHSWLKLHHTAHSKHVAAGFHVAKNKSSGLNTKGRALNGASSLSWMSLNAFLMSKNSHDGTLTSYPSMYENFVLKSDLTQADQCTYGKNIIIHGSNFVLTDTMKPEHAKVSLPLTYIGAHLQYLNLGIDS